ncbi:aminoglycoside phosphotransferase family protein [Micromonospora sp. NPDC047548]|uniref:phosphotransferase enzyme family protein n=1 Tax=Micromonospora sp. NPDC047548 TaxID=3155624 RepID=UPI0033F2E5AF
MSTASYDAVRAACQRVGLGISALKLIREGENAVWAVDSETIAKVGRPGSIEQSSRQVRVAQWLRRAGVPSVSLCDVNPQPVVVADIPVVFWRRLPSHQAGHVVDVARLLRQLHDLDPPTDLGLPELDPLVRLPERVCESEVIDRVRREWILRRIDSLRVDWKRLPDGLPRCVIHGDAWVGNVAVHAYGTAVLLDLERCSIGPPEWDLVSTAIKLESFAWIGHEEYRQFVAVYGSDVTHWPGFALMRDTRELRMATFLVQRAGQDSTLTREALYRIDCLRGLHGGRPWRWTPST